MEYKIYRLTFPSGVHIGSGNLSSAQYTMNADTFFSAMCIEALAIGGADDLARLVKAAKEGKLIFSDILPFVEDELYIPKPMCRIESAEKDPTRKKAYKKMKYIPFSELETYLSGGTDPATVNEDFAYLGTGSARQKVMIKYNEDNEPYTVGVYEFNEGCGLYAAAVFADTETKNMFETILSSLAYSGIGGKRTAGYGRFTWIAENASDKLKKRIAAECGRYMTLTACMASDDELEDVLKDAQYKLIKRSGYVQSQTYSDNYLKKRDFYLFAAGGVFTKKFGGDVFDVSSQGTHPVYKYAKPLMIGIGDRNDNSVFKVL